MFNPNPKKQHRRMQEKCDKQFNEYVEFVRMEEDDICDEEERKRVFGDDFSGVELFATFVFFVVQGNVLHFPWLYGAYPLDDAGEKFKAWCRDEFITRAEDAWVDMQLPIEERPERLNPLPEGLNWRNLPLWAPKEVDPREGVRGQSIGTGPMRRDRSSQVGRSARRMEEEVDEAEAMVEADETASDDEVSEPLPEHDGEVLERAVSICFLLHGLRRLDFCRCRRLLQSQPKSEAPQRNKPHLCPPFNESPATDLQFQRYRRRNDHAGQECEQQSRRRHRRRRGHRPGQPR